MFVFLKKPAADPEAQGFQEDAVFLTLEITPGESEEAEI